MAHIGIVHPGAMGAWIATALRASGHEVAWASDGRSDATRDRADTAGLTDVGDLATLARTVEAVVSVCPPAAATAMAEAVLAAGFTGLFVDANAIAPASARQIETMLADSGASMVDGGIVGGPSDQPKAHPPVPVRPSGRRGGRVGRDGAPRSWSTVPSGRPPPARTPPRPPFWAP